MTELPVLSVVAEFGERTFLENLAVRSDNSVLVSVLSSSELAWVPAPAGDLPVEPRTIHAFEDPPLGISEQQPDVFYICTSDLFGSHRSQLHRLDLNGWVPGDRVEVAHVLDFPARARGLNGVCRLDPRVMLIADCFAGLIWRVDIPDSGVPDASVWLEHESMGYLPGSMSPEQPGVNGLGYVPALGYLYYSCTAKKLLMRVRVDPVTYVPQGAPEHVDAGRLSDDFCIDECAGVLYAATHRQNTIDRVSLDPRGNAGPTPVLAGDPIDDRLLGPSSVRWQRGAEEAGRAVYVTTDGGMTAPPPSGARTAKLLSLGL